MSPSSLLFRVLVFTAFSGAETRASPRVMRSATDNHASQITVIIDSSGEVDLSGGHTKAAAPRVMRSAASLAASHGSSGIDVDQDRTDGATMSTHGVTVGAEKPPMPAEDFSKKWNNNGGEEQKSDSDLLTQLWDGMDVEGIQLDNLLNATKFDIIPIDLRTELPKLQILGMFDSGTNLLRALLKQNFGDAVFNRMCPNANHDSCQFWKHTEPQHVNPAGLHMVALVRAPLSHLSSWIKAPYDLRKCMSQVNWLNDQAVKCDLSQRNFNGPTQVWNGYAQGYQRLLTEGKHIKIIEYENLVLNTEKVVRDIGEFLGVSVGPFHQVTAPAKTHGKPCGREAALEKIRTSAHMTNAPWSDARNVEAVCRNLDEVMMEAHRIQLSDSDQRLYTYDCLPGADKLLRREG